MKNLPGKLCISRRTSNMEPEYFVIEVEDDASGVLAASIRVSPADLMLAISGRGGLPVSVEWRADRIGLRAETKTEVVRCDGIGMTKTQKRAAVALFEVDGWVGDASAIGNGHCRVEGGYRVTFRRWVKGAEG